MTSLDRVFDLLSKERRRYALYFLEQQDGPVTVDAVSEQVAEWESNSGTVSIPDRKFEQVEIELQHVDLPKAAELTYIEFDPDEEVVEVTDEPVEFKAIISVARTIERPDRHP